MPSKYVFPGGAVEPDDDAVAFARPLETATRAALAVRSAVTPETLAAAAIRELAEETGQRLAEPGAAGAGASGWPGFDGLVPDAGALRFVFRAITPPGRPRRFDARFLLAPAEALHGDPDDFGAAEAELSDLAWVPLREARALDLPFVTEVALGEAAAHLRGEGSAGVPVLDNTGPGSQIWRVPV